LTTASEADATLARLHRFRRAGQQKLLTFHLLCDGCGEAVAARDRFEVKVQRMERHHGLVRRRGQRADHARVPLRPDAPRARVSTAAALSTVNAPGGVAQRESGQPAVHFRRDACTTPARARAASGGKDTAWHSRARDPSGDRRRPPLRLRAPERRWSGAPCGGGRGNQDQHFLGASEQRRVSLRLGLKRTQAEQRSEEDASEATDCECRVAGRFDTPRGDSGSKVVEGGAGGLRAST